MLIVKPIMGYHSCQEGSIFDQNLFSIFKSLSTKCAADYKLADAEEDDHNSLLARAYSCAFTKWLAIAKCEDGRGVVS
jgi:hypothetical protein